MASDLDVSHCRVIPNWTLNVVKLTMAIERVMVVHDCKQRRRVNVLRYFTEGKGGRNDWRQRSVAIIHPASLPPLPLHPAQHTPF